MKRLLLFLCAGMIAAGCATQPDGTPLVITGPNLVLAEGLFTTYRIAHTTDDCDKIDVPGVFCTIRKWDFEGTKLEVEVPEGFELTGTGLDGNEYWFSVHCTRAPASGEGEVKARVMAEGRARYEGVGKVSCRPIDKANLTGLSFWSPARGVRRFVGGGCTASHLAEYHLAWENSVTLGESEKSQASEEPRVHSLSGLASRLRVV